MSDNLGAPQSPQQSPGGPPPRTKSAKVVDFGMVAIVVVALGFAGYMQFGQPEVRSELEGVPAPNFNLKTLSGDVDGLEEHRGKVVILDFWATWCGPCRKQMPYLEEIEEDPELAERVEIILINTDNPSPQRDGKVGNFLRSGGWTWDSLIDNGRVAAMYRVSAYPTIIVVSPDGTIAHVQSGVHSTRKLRKLIDAAGAS